MPVERPKQFAGMPRFAGAPRPGGSRPSSQASQAHSTPDRSRATQLGLGLGRGAAGLGLGKGKVIKRHMKVQRDNIHGVTKGDIRRLARRGGVKRISTTVYDDIRSAMKQRLELILKDACAIVELTGRKTVSVTDIIFTLNRHGRPIYGFDPSYVGRRH